MRYRLFPSGSMRATVLRVACLAVIPPVCTAPFYLARSADQGSAVRTTKGYTAPKTPWGDPDLQGQWPASANIPMQRPLALADKGTLTDEEFAKRQAQAAKQA